jgi:hypothetical protein
MTVVVRQTAILQQVIDPEQGGFSPEHARYVLSLDFSAEQHAKYAELSDRAQAGKLSPQEQVELDDFLSVNAFLTILQSKARVSLSKHNSAA